ncbi:hypothetical protein L596_017620 [Steinernema carpocapsae]|uniref:Protein kinase domain-containing protein n=1 Tax=Steinernema carpocapsae TaxID=34508 RepID=A0A4U5N2M5_STECR|nr:hypothetical protein L596_017620 [Steinernema carpocapsae]
MWSPSPALVAKTSPRLCVFQFDSDLLPGQQSMLKNNGSYGIVKLAYNEQDKNLYALKVLDKIKLLKNFACFRAPPARKNKPAPAVCRNPLQLVQKEIAILKKLNHPNVVRLIEVLDDPSDNYLYMVFEYVERGSILEIPTEQPLDEELAWRYFRDTLKGLEYLTTTSKFVEEHS